MFTLHLQVELTQLGIAVIMDDYNDISRCPLVLRFPDGICDYGRLQRHLTVSPGSPFSRRHQEICLYHVGRLDSGSAGDGQDLL